MKILITGINGQVGSYLAESYLLKGYEVHGLIRPRGDTKFINGIRDKLVLHMQDIKDSHGVYRTIHIVKPDVIHHLAAMTFVPYSWENPIDTFDCNVDGTINILEAARSTVPMPIVHFVGSSEEYGIVPPEEVPVTEDTPIRPGSPYGISKVTGDLLSQQYHKSYGLDTRITRAFNHTSPRRGKGFVTMQVVTQALQIKHGKRKKFTLGNLDAIRDYSDAREIVRAYHAAVTSDWVRPGTPYNVCSQKGTSVRELVEMVSAIAGVPGEVEQDPSRMRPSDLPILVGSSERFREATGWANDMPLRDTLSWMLETLEMAGDY